MVRVLRPARQYCRGQTASFRGARFHIFRAGRIPAKWKGQYTERSACMKAHRWTMRRWLQNTAIFWKVSAMPLAKFMLPLLAGNGKRFSGVTHYAAQFAEARLAAAPEYIKRYYMLKQF